MIGTPAQDAFINKNKWAVVTSLRKDGSPTSSVVFFFRDGDDLLFSTTTTRLKGTTIRHDQRVAFCVLDEGAPYGYVTVEGPATIETADLVAKHVALNKVMRGGDFTPPEGFEERLKSEGRIIVRVRANRVSGVTNRG